MPCVSNFEALVERACLGLQEIVRVDDAVVAS